MRLSVIIPTCGRPESLERALRSLATQSAMDFEAIVVCDGPDESTRALSETLSLPFQLSWIFLPRQGGQAAARNAGAERAQHQVLVFLDDDCVPVPGWIEAHTKHHARSAQLVVLGRVESAYERPTKSAVENYLRGSAIAADARRDAALTDCVQDRGGRVWVGLNTSLPRKLFLSTGGFDPSWRHVFEDIDLGERVAAAGGAFVYEPAAFVKHHETKDLAVCHRDRASHCGTADVLRARKGQASLSLHDLDQLAWWERAYEMTAWYFPWLVRWSAHASCFAAEWTGLRWFFQVWVRLDWSGWYWQGVREAGMTRDELRRLARQSARPNTNRSGVAAQSGASR